MLDFTDLEHMLSLSRHMVETHALQPLLEYAMNEALQLVGAERGYIVLLNEDGTLDFRVRQGVDADELGNTGDQVSMSILQTVLQTGQPQVIKSAVDDPQWKLSKSVALLKLRSVLCVPLISGGKSIGAIYVENRLIGNRFDEAGLATLALFARQASVSIENARLYNLLEQQVQQMLIEEERLRTVLAKETELSQLKSRMMERIAHEFRTPLAIIQTSTSTLDLYLERLTVEQRNNKFKHIYDQVNRLSDLLGQIGFVMNGHVMPEAVQFSRTDLSSVCRQTAQELETQFAQPGKYILDLPDSLMVHADAGALRNLVFHIMHNAAQFSAANSPVSVSLSTHDQDVELTVSDRGIGILPEEQGHIFETFFRGTNIGEVSGLGLGLTIAKACVDLHQGSLIVESIPEQGTTVRIWLPELAVSACPD
ncbi:MAG: GAF domain-containing sensor histidine kinase [Anaerolineae bacterium]